MDADNRGIQMGCVKVTLLTCLSRSSLDNSRTHSHVHCAQKGKLQFYRLVFLFLNRIPMFFLDLSMFQRYCLPYLFPFYLPASSSMGENYAKER